MKRTGPGIGAAAPFPPDPPGADPGALIRQRVGFERALETAPRGRREGWLRSLAVLSLLGGLAFGLGAPAPASAQDRRGLRFGIALPLERAGVTFEKAVDNTDPDTLVPAPRSGRVFEDEGSASGLFPGWALLAGYRWPLGGAAFVSAEADFAFHRGALEGQLEGSGTTPSRRQLGEAWPDEWSFEKRRRYGVTMRLGASPGALGSREESVYVLAGLHRVAARMTVHWRGCVSPVPCSADQFTSGGDPRDLDFVAWTVGVGFEKGLGERVAIRAEGRYAGYGEQGWVSDLPEVRVTVPASVRGGGPGLSLMLVLGR